MARLGWLGLAGLCLGTMVIMPSLRPALDGAQAPQGGGRGGAGGLGSAYPQRPAADPAAIERGRAQFGVQCGFCHGSDARGATTGPNLWRSSVVLMDKEGESIGQVLREGRVEKGMPAFELTATQASDLVAFLHSFPVGGRDPARKRPESIVVGAAAAGRTYFEQTCASCHSAAGDLKGLATKYADPRQLQQAWLMPGSGRGGRGAPRVEPPPLRVVVTLPTGQKVEGTLNRIDDFIVSLTDGNGWARTFPRHGDTPKVEVHDPFEPHRVLVPKYTDADIHNLTAYLVTLK